jgi:hypothetical protein
VALHLDREGRTRVHDVWVDGDGMAGEHGIGNALTLTQAIPFLTCVRG